MPHVLAGADQHLRVVRVDDQKVADLDACKRIANLTHDGNVERARDDRDVRVGRALFEDDRLQRTAVIVEQLRGSEVTRDEDELVSRGKVERRVFALQKVLEKAVREILRDRARVRAGTRRKPGACAREFRR